MRKATSARTVLTIAESAALPKLGWSLRQDETATRLVVGTGVERCDHWWADGAWAGPFDRPDFEGQFLIGTAGEVTPDGVRVHAPATPMDRVFMTKVDGGVVASNSLPIVLNSIDDELDPADITYRSLFTGLVVGLRVARRSRTMRTKRGRSIRVLVSETAEIAAGVVRRIDLRPLDPPFKDFDEYRSYIADNVRALFENVTASSRRQVYPPVVALSGGYDSTTAAVFAAEAGCTDAVTMVARDEHGDLVDHPGFVAKALGFELREVQRGQWLDSSELKEAEIAAAASNLIDLPMLTLESAVTGRTLVVGHSGDNVWKGTAIRDYRDVVRGDTSGQGLAEHRLRAAYLLLPVPYIGHTSHRSIRALSGDSALDPWRMGGAYDRPIARRIIEEAGVPRGTFAAKKYAGGGLVGSNNQRVTPSTLSAAYAGVLSPTAIASFAAFVASHEFRPPALSMAGHRVFHKLDAANIRAGRRLRRFGIRGLVPRSLMAAAARRYIVYPDVSTLLPHWGSKRLQHRYRSGEH